MILHYCTLQFVKIVNVFLGGASLIAQLVMNLPAGDPGSILRAGRSAGEVIGYPLSILGLLLWLNR